MKSLIPLFSDVYIQEKALVWFKNQSTNHSYVESYDFDDNGGPINPHPLSIQESVNLAKSLDSSDELKQGFLTSKGILPNNVLYIKSNSNGYAIWHTPTMITDLYFNDFLPIPDGKAYIPPMIWKASKNQLQVFAVLNVKRPSLEMPLFNAPFFNIGKSGTVCMGNVSIDISSSTNLEDFIVKWMRYFFDSKFTHLLIDNLPTKILFSCGRVL